MSLAGRCDDIVRLIDQTLHEIERQAVATALAPRAARVVAAPPDPCPGGADVAA